MEDKYVNFIKNELFASSLGSQTPSEGKPLVEQGAGNVFNGVEVTSALYKILDFLPEQDPLKNKAKEKALAVLENLTLISSAQGWISLQKEKASATVLDDIGVLRNYLEIGKRQGWIDTVNFLIITKEYDAIKSKIKPPEGLIKQSLEISYRVAKENSLGPQKPTAGAFQIPWNKELPPVRPKSRHSMRFSIKSEQIQNDSEQKPLLGIDIDPTRNVVILENKKQNIKQFSERQEKILHVLSESGKGQVADFVKELPNVTKRTIRRDLDNLLKKGKIVRNGKWNQVFYTLAVDVKI